MTPNAAIILSPFCDNDCIFCGNRPRCSHQELSIQENLIYRNVAHHLSRGVREIEISGGDPGEYHALPDLVRYLKDSGFSTVRLSTNGCRCADAGWVNALVDAGLDAVKIPLYGATATVHEQVARKPGCFRSAVRALENFRDRGAGIAINTLIVQQNRKGLIDLHRLMLSFTDWRRCVFSVPCLIRNGESFYIPIRELHRDCIPLIYVGAMNDTPPIFSELPLCVFGFHYPFIRQGRPPRQGIQQPPPEYRSHVRDVPTYRLKQKPFMCAACLVNTTCDGFFQNDLDRYGTGGLQPFRQASPHADRACE